MSCHPGAAGLQTEDSYIGTLQASIITNIDSPPHVSSIPSSTPPALVTVKMTPLGSLQTLLTGHITGGDKAAYGREGGGAICCHGVRTRTHRQVGGDDSGHVEGKETSQTTVPPGA